MYINIDNVLMAEARKVSGQTSSKKVVEEALRLFIKMRQQRNMIGAFGKYRWSGDLARSRSTREIGRAMRLK